MRQHQHALLNALRVRAPVRDYARGGANMHVRQVPQLRRPWPPRTHLLAAWTASALAGRSLAVAGRAAWHRCRRRSTRCSSGLDRAEQRLVALRQRSRYNVPPGGSAAASVGWGSCRLACTLPWLLARTGSISGSRGCDKSQSASASGVQARVLCCGAAAAAACEQQQAGSAPAQDAALARDRGAAAADADGGDGAGAGRQVLQPASALGKLERQQRARQVCSSSACQVWTCGAAPAAAPRMQMHACVLHMQVRHHARCSACMLKATHGAAAVTAAAAGAVQRR